MRVLLDLLPVLGSREAWAVGLVVVLAVLRPVGRLGWTAAIFIALAAITTVGQVVATQPDAAMFDGPTGRRRSR